MNGIKRLRYIGLTSSKIFICFAILASSCSLLNSERSVNSGTYSEKMFRCVTELIGKYNVPSEKATTACKIIFGGQQ